MKHYFTLIVAFTLVTASAFVIAAQTTVTITQSNDSTTITDGNSISCNAGGPHADNAYLRVFDLPAFGIENGLDVTNIQVGIDEAASVGGAGQPIEVNLYTKAPASALTYANLTPIGSANFTINDTALTLFDMPVTGTVTTGLDLVVEVFTPNGQTDGHVLFIGSNAAGQTDASYVAAAACGFAEPVTTATVGFPDMHIVMSVTGNTLVPGTEPNPNPVVIDPAAFAVPNLGEVMISTSSPQPVYESAGGGVVRVNTNELWLPRDADGNGSDTYIVTEIAVVNEETWLALFVGSDTWVWVPFDSVTPMRFIGEVQAVVEVNDSSNGDADAGSTARADVGAIRSVSSTAENSFSTNTQ